MQTSERWMGRFVAIWTGQTLSLIGSRLGGFALVWWLTIETGSAQVLATASLGIFIPRLLFLPIAGALVDRWSRRWIILISDAFIALVSLWLAIMFWRGAMEIWHVYLVIIGRAIGGAFHEPALTASTSMLVPEAQLSRVSGLNHTVIGGINLAGPMMGALAITLLPLHGVMLIDVATAAFALIPILLFTIPQPKRSAATREASVWGNMMEAVRYLRHVPGLVILMLTFTLGNFITSPIGSFLPLYIRDHFQGGAFHFAGLQSGWAIGYILGGLLFTLWAGFKRKTTTMFVASSLQGVGLLMLAIAPRTAILLAVAGQLLGGIMNTYLNAPERPLYQANVPHELQGRVFALGDTLSYALYPLGLIVATPIVEHFGVRPLIFIGGGYLLFTGLFALVPAIRNLEFTLNQKRTERERETEIE